MMRVALLSCVKRKCDGPVLARDLYTSPLFRGLRRHAETHADAWYILSAEHGLLAPDELVARYDRTLLRMSSDARRASVREAEVTPGGRPPDAVRPSDPLARFYQLIDALRRKPGQGQPLGSYTGQHAWPTRGVYFFFEPDELRSTPAGGAATSRVVRVGTHAVSAGSTSTLWRRLRAHRGRAHTGGTAGGAVGGGNHRGSIFRLHVGAALLRRDAVNLPTWGTQSAAKAERAVEAAHEQAVSAYLAAMRVVWVAVPDAPGPASARSLIERGAIALLTNGSQPSDRPSTDWLGRHSPRAEIRESGLWNVNYVGGAVVPTFLDILEAHVETTA